MFSLVFFYSSAKLPTGEYRWLTDAEIAAIDFTEPPDVNADTSYFVECDLEIPETLHRELSDFPPAPENTLVERDSLSEVARTQLANAPGNGNQLLAVPKLVASLSPKKNYICHQRALHTYLRMGVKITRIHKVLAFEQKDFVREYIQKMTLYRQQASTFSQTLAKLLMNACFGRFAMNRKKFFQAQFSLTAEKSMKLMASPYYESHRILSEQSVIFFIRKQRIKLQSHLLVAASILDISRSYMYELYHFKMRPRIPRLRLLYSGR